MAEAGRYERLIGRVRGRAPGPMLIIVGGVHGNEPAGVRAAEKVLARLAAERVELIGDLVALTGNLRALRLGRRYQVRDLNRQWSMRALSAAGTGATDDAEELEQRELRAALDEAIASARGPLFFIDLHTTSAAGLPFAMVGDTLRHRAFARHFPLPLILGLEEQIDGVLAEYMTERGCVTLACEGGQHQSPESVHHLEALLWLALAAAGLCPRSALPGHDAAWVHLDRARAGLPRVIEVLARHPVTAEDKFVMEPGFANIGRVQTGQLLARDCRGDIRAPSNGLVLLPLYQALGEDGFFLGRAIRGREETAALLARRLRLDALLPLLPGVQMTPAGLGLDARVAERYPMALFRLFGFRRVVRGARGEVTLRRRAQG